MSESTNGLKCPSCGYANITKSGLRKLANKEEKVQQYYCPECGRTTRKPCRVLNIEKVVAQ